MKLVSFDMFFPAVIMTGCIIRSIMLKRGSSILKGVCLSCERKYDVTTIKVRKYRVEYEYTDYTGEVKRGASIVNSAVEVGSEFDILLRNNGTIIPAAHLRLLRTVAELMAVVIVIRPVIKIFQYFLLPH